MPLASRDFVWKRTESGSQNSLKLKLPKHISGHMWNLPKIENQIGSVVEILIFINNRSHYIIGLKHYNKVNVFKYDLYKLSMTKFKSWSFYNHEFYNPLSYPG